jgi:hypothetical protein
LIEQQLGQKINAAAVSPRDVITMTQAGVGEELIITHVQVHGVVAPPSAQQIIELKQAGVSDRVIQALQTARPPQVVAGPPGAPVAAPVIVEEHYFGPRPYYWHPWWGGYRRRPGWSVGVGFGG